MYLLHLLLLSTALATPTVHYCTDPTPIDCTGMGVDYSNCPGQPDKYGCPTTDTCARAGESCPNYSSGRSSNCSPLSPVDCSAGEKNCQGPYDPATGCFSSDYCADTCPCERHTPLDCSAGGRSCPGPYDPVTGCVSAGFCVSTGETCPPQ